MMKSLDEVKKKALQDPQILMDKRFSVCKNAQGFYYIKKVGEAVPPDEFIIEYAKLNGKWMQVR